MKNWKTTSIGALGAALAVIFPKIAAEITAVTVTVLSFFTKDYDTK